MGIAWASARTSSSVILCFHEMLTRGDSMKLSAFYSRYAPAFRAGSAFLIEAKAERAS